MKSRKHLRPLFIPLAVAAAIVVPATVAISAGLVRIASSRMFRDAGSVPWKPVAIVLGARVYADGTPSPVLEDRLDAARRLYLAGRVRKILASGDHLHRNYDEVRVMQRWLVAHGVAADDVVLDHAGIRTLDTMQRAVRVFGVNQAVICTQEFHLPRALFLARAAGIDAVGFVAEERHYGLRRVEAAREFLARTRAILDVYMLSTRARFVGPPIPIDVGSRSS